MTIPGYKLNDPSLPPAPISDQSFSHMKTATLFGPEDEAALRRSLPILEPQIEAILDVWYGFVGSHGFLVEHFSTPQGAAIGDYLDRVRARFGQWIRDTARAEYDSRWLAWQIEIGRRHHRVGKNVTDGADSTALVPFRILFLLAQPIVDTLRPFLEHTGESRDTVDAMQNAWRKSVLLQLTLWSHPYIREGDF